MERLNNPARRPLVCTRDFLKWFGFLCMFLGSFGVAVLQRGILHLDTTDLSVYDALLPGSGVMGTASMAVACSLAATLAIPIYAFLTAESYRRCDDEKKYLTRLAILAVASEVPYDWAMFGKAWDFTAQNPALALVVAVIMLFILDEFSRPGIKGWLMGAPVVLSACIWVAVFGCQNGVVLVLLTAVFYLMRKMRKAKLWMAAAVSLFHFPAPFGVLLLNWYDGEPQKTPKWVFYALYPAHLLVLGLAVQLMK